MLERDELLGALRRDGAAFAATLADTPLDAPVPGCPEWTAADLWWHVTFVHGFWRHILAERADSPEGFRPPEPPAPGELAATYLAGLEELVDLLAATPGETPVWTWTPDHSAAWILRRMAHETAIHLVDAQETAGVPAAVEPALASDGVDEFLQWFTGRVAEGEDAHLRGSVHLHCTDVPGEWFVVDGDGDGDGDGLVVTREHAKGDCALRGPASDLILALWRRIPLERLDVVGDADLAARFVARTALS